MSTPIPVLTQTTKAKRSLQDWIATSQLEFTQIQQFMDEMSAGFNELYKEERITLAGDFRVLDDWRRDADRMTSSIRIEDVNILLRRTPSQLLLKGASVNVRIHT